MPVTCHAPIARGAAIPDALRILPGMNTSRNPLNNVA
jgi:hypothetical protein